MLAAQITTSNIAPESRDLGDLATALRRMRRTQARHLAEDLFADPAWDMLLDLFAAECEGTPFSISALCAGAGVPLTTAWRYLAMLEAKMLVGRRPDIRDRRRTILYLTPRARTGIADILESFIADLVNSANAFIMKT